MLAVLTSILFNTQIASKGLDPLVWEVGGTVEAITAIELMRPNWRKKQA